VADPEAGRAGLSFDGPSIPLPFFPEITWQSVNELMHFSGSERDVLARQMDCYLISSHLPPWSFANLTAASKDVNCTAGALAVQNCTLQSAAL